MFPARAGMSLNALPHGFQPVNVPRASGDEPVTVQESDTRKLCSPRERG